mmetsp:Transcript_48798/g.156053  ORF Transcript_48798/g.156053 Transcript_48798/m.156053 type:complete len:355 (-) Transcript_48798:14-1078(-)
MEVRVDAADAVCASLRGWLDENKRLEDFRLVSRQLEALLAGLARAERKVVLGAAAAAGTCSAPAAACSGAAAAVVAPAVATGTAGVLAGSEACAEAACAAAAADATPGAVASTAGAAPGAAGHPGPGSAVLLLVFGNGARVRSVCRYRPAAGPVEPAAVDLTMCAKHRGDKDEVPFVEFHGQRSSDLRVDEAKYLVDHDVVARLQSELMPSLPRPIVFLDMLLSLPLAVADEPGGGPVPFRLHILEDMLSHECWAEESDSELIGDLDLSSDSGCGEDAAGPCSGPGRPSTSGSLRGGSATAAAPVMAAASAGTAATAVRDAAWRPGIEPQERDCATGGASTGAPCSRRGKRVRR